MQLSARLAYCVFLWNAHKYLPFIEKERVPFVFTLYPGGRFGLDDPESDQNLRRVFDSPYFRRVIVTQAITRDYLLQKGLCGSDQMEFIYGGVFPAHIFDGALADKPYYLEHKKTLDLCFVAHKYTDKGVDKGYDVFIEVAKLLKTRFSNLRFHIVGDFGRNDVDIAGIEDQICFYGPRHRGFFPSFYSGMDVILSPNKAFQLARGQFDGFPTGCCIEAGLSGVAVFCTDPLGMNHDFTNGRDLVIIPSDAPMIADVLGKYLTDPSQLYLIAKRGQSEFAKVFNLEQQMARRISLLGSCS
jgi:glycosyltransferase involved in cell wall biosynthesis